MTSETNHLPRQRLGLGIALFIVAGMCFAVLDATAKYLTRDFSVWQISWARFAFAALIMLAFAQSRAALSDVRTVSLRSAKHGWQIVRALLLTGTSVLFFLSFPYLPLADALSISFAAPLIVTALSAPLLGEVVGVRRWIAVSVGFAGVLVVMRPGFDGFHWAALFVVAMAITNALFMITTRFVGRYDSAFISAFYGTLVGMCLLSVVVPFIWTPPSLTDWLLLGVVGAFGALSHYLLPVALAHAPASILAPYAYVQLIWETIAGYAVFGDLPDGAAIVGAVIIAASGVYIFSQDAALRRPPG